MSIEELLNPRYKVIADYPKSIHKVGTVYNCGGSSEDMLYADTDGPRMRDYPHLFKKLEWWEERDEKDMPEYVKLVMDNKIQYIHKVELWNGVNQNGQPLYEYKNRVNYQTTACISELEPATREEYEKYLQSKK